MIMNESWYLNTHGNPLGALREFIKEIWQQSNLEGMLVTVTDDDEIRTIPLFITDVAEVDKINPFKPLMEVNIAKLLPGVISKHPGEKIGAVLRPCEMRALIEMTKHSPLDIEDLLTISVDCLGTLPATEYQWRLERVENIKTSETARSPESTDELAREAIRFAKQGGIVPYRYRAACQVCASPAAEQAQVNINVLELPVRQKMLVTQGKAIGRVECHFDKLADGKADENIIHQHELLLAKMSERHQRSVERINEALGGLQPVDVDAAIRLLESCGDCHKCMDVCPICSVDQPTQNAEGHMTGRV
jgi:formate dehydrogenase subunit beta